MIKSIYQQASATEREKAVDIALKAKRDEVEPTLRSTFINQVNANSKLGNAVIDTIPSVADIAPGKCFLLIVRGLSCLEYFFRLTKLRPK